MRRLCASSAAKTRWIPRGGRSAASAVKSRTWRAGPTAGTGFPATRGLHRPTTRQTTMADTLSIVDNRTGKKYELPIQDGAIRAMDLRQIKVSSDDFGLMTYDPAFMNTANCRSAITYIDGEKGVLLYRGYPIEQLAEDSDFLETAYLILFGELPTTSQLHGWTREITLHTMLHENIKKFMEGFQYDA